MEIELNTSELKEKAKTLRAGDKVLLSGTVYTSRDAAHKRIKACIENGEPLPYEIDGAAIYYAGPTQAPAVPPPPAEWTYILPCCLIWGFPR